MKKLLIVGTKGQGKVVLDCALSMNIYNEIVFMTNEINDSEIVGYQILDQNKTSMKYIKDNFDEVIVAVGLNNSARLNLSKKFEEEGIKLATLIHPTSTVSNFSKIGSGTVLFANSVVNPFAKIGKACIINTGVIVEHDCVVSDGVHISPNSAIAGRVNIGENTWICMGCCVAHDVSIGKNVVVGAGAAVIKDVPDNVLVAGVPAVIHKKYNQ